jgi:hypothetical protein
MKGARQYHRYPPRVHLFTKFDRNYVGQMRFAMAAYDASPEDYYHGRVDEPPPIVVVRVDINKLRRGTKFFGDPDANDAVWTYTHVPPAALSVHYEDKEEEA